MTDTVTASHDDDETESECDLPEDLEDDGGDTTDTLDDTDHLGMIRFGIEAAESDDEDAEEALANIIRDRNLIDAHNMGLSVSIEALAEQPEAVVAKTARSLGISTETAAKILTSVGMSLLMRSDSHSRDVFVEPRPSTSAISDEASKQQQESRVVQSSASGPIPSTSAQPATSVAQPANSNVNKTFEPVLGDFAPAGEADFCVVVGASDAPAPSPFSARKRRTRSSTRGFVSNVRSSLTITRSLLLLFDRHTHLQSEEDSLSHQPCQAPRLHLQDDTHIQIRQKSRSTTSSWNWTILSIQACFQLV